MSEIETDMVDDHFEGDFKPSQTQYPELEPRYFPIEKAIYETGPGLRPLGFSLGQGEWDKRFFQISQGFQEYRKNKKAAWNEDPSKYWVQAGQDPDVLDAICLKILDILKTEYPHLFKVYDYGSGIQIIARHTGDYARITHSGRLLMAAVSGMQHAQIRDLFQFLSLQVPEDMVLLQGPTPDHGDRLSYLSVTSPTHWAPGDKIGKSFFQIHSPIPGLDKLVRASNQLVEAMIFKGPYVRFVWSFVTDTRLNHHPIPAPGMDPAEWRGRSFDASKPDPFYLRVERQVTLGFPQFNQSLFLIRIGFWSAREIKQSEILSQQLIGALNSMTPESRAYKGVDQCFDEFVSWLQK